MLIKPKLTKFLPSLSSLRAAASGKDCAYNFAIATPHASARMPLWQPKDSLDGIDVDDVSDVGSGDLGTYIARALGGRHIPARFSRQYVDVNRSLLDPASIPDQNGLTDGDLAGRLYESQRYHKEISKNLDDLTEDDDHTYVVNLHSFSRVKNGVTRQVDIGVPVPSFSKPASLGLLNELKSVARKSAQRGFLERKSGMAYRVVQDEPYAGTHPGNYLCKEHKRRNSVTVLTIEVCNDLLFPEGVRAIGDLIAASLAALAAAIDANTQERIQHAV